MKRIAFYAPVKPPDHPIPSGDREISKLLIKAMRQGGYEVELASRFIAYQKRPGDELFEMRRSGGKQEADRLLEHYRSLPANLRPQLWFTYHTYCKAPDYLGPHISRELAIPYVTAEACRTRQNTDADWQNGREIVQEAIRCAAINFCLKPSDMEYLANVLDTMESVVNLPPFVDESLIQSSANTPRQRLFDNYDPVAITVGMMRPGKKFECYEILAKALESVGNSKWNLVIVGDGPERASIEALFTFVPENRIRWLGLVDPREVHRLMAACDIFAWPGFKEPIGMVYLEAQALGLPVAAMASLGVPTVVPHDRTGLLSPDGDVFAYSKNLSLLIADAALRERYGRAGPDYIQHHHGIEAAAKLITEHLEEL